MPTSDASRPAPRRDPARDTFSTPEAGLRRLVYSSRATVPISIRNLAEMLRNAHRRNFRSEVTGVLLHHDGGLIQCLEGPAAAVEAIYADIACDKRHRLLVLLYDQPIARRLFPWWYMAHGEIDARTWVRLNAAPWLTHDDAAFELLVQTWENLRTHAVRGVEAEPGPPGY